MTEDGSEDTDAQPPFLLSYSAELFAREIPAIFEHNPSSNRLSLREGVHPPWVRPKHGRQKDKENTWLYCNDCRETHVGQKSNVTHVPFRDKDAQRKMKPEYRREKCAPEPPLDVAAPEFMFPEVPANVAESNSSALDAIESASLRDAVERDDVGEGEEILRDDHLHRLQTANDWVRFPSIEDYRLKWEIEKAKHLQANSDPFGEKNLVPQPNEYSMQDVPWVPFQKLTSEDAQARLSVTRPLGQIEEAQVIDGVSKYAHITGDVQCCRRNPLQLAATFACILNQRDGAFTGLSRSELEAWHECLCWLREPGNNKVLRLYGTQYERLTAACSRLQEVLQSRGVLPEGSLRAQIRWSKRFGPEIKTGTLGDTLGQERCGIVVVDGACNPMSHAGIKELGSIVATQEYRLDVHLPNPDGRGWSRRSQGVCTDSCPQLGAAWREDLTSGAKFVAEETWVPANDPHYDAKCWPVSHPYGSGSLLSEQGSGGTQKLARNRLALPQSWFRRTSSYLFWMLDRLHKTAMFFQEKKRRQEGRPTANANDADPINKLFGTREPHNIPETTGNHFSKQRSKSCIWVRFARLSWRAA